MATYYVATDGTDSAGTPGTTGDPWQTLTYAHERIAPGDTVKIKPGTYPAEELTITKANTTWTVDGDGSTPVILDGGYSYATAGKANGELIDPWRITPVPPIAGTYKSAITIKANGVTIDGVSKYGIRLYDIGGRFFAAFDCEDVTVTNVWGDFSYYMCFLIGNVAGGEITTRNITVSHCAFTRINNIHWSDTERNARGAYITPSSLMIMTCDNVLIDDVYLAYGPGEGISCDVGSENVTVQYSEFHNHGHLLGYTLSSKNNVYDGNLFWADPWCTDHERGSTPDRRLAGGIVAGDEGKRGRGIKSRNPKYYNNIIIGPKDSFTVSGSTSSNPDDNYRFSMTDFYFGYNTVIGYRPPGLDHPDVGSRYLLKINNTWEANNGTPHGGIVENNLFFFLDGHESTDTTRPPGLMAGNQDVIFRKNMWQSLPQASVRGTGDLSGTPDCVNQKFRVPRTNYNRRAARCSITSIRDDVAQWLALKAGSPAIAKAATGSVNGRRGTYTPPTITKDFLGNTRTGANFDLGAIEFDGTPPDPEDTLTAAFGQSATNGNVPLTVNFTDQSVSSGTVTGWAWDFGDGQTSTEQNPSHSYTTAGQYAPSLTVTDSNGLTRTAAGQTITVLADGGNPGPDPGDPPGLKTGAIVQRIALPTSLGDVTLTPALAGGVPRAILAIASNVTTAGTAADDAVISLGVWAGSSSDQYCDTIHYPDGVTPAEATASHERGVLVKQLDGSSVVGSLRVKAVGPDSITLECTDAFPAAGLCTLVIFGGSGLSAAVDDPYFGGVGANATIPNGDAMIAFGTRANEAIDSTGELMFGAAAGTASANVSHLFAPANQASVRCSLDATSIAHAMEVSYGNRAYVVVADTGLGTGRVTGYIPYQSELTMAGIRVDGRAALKYYGEPAATGVAAYDDIGFRPGLAILWGCLNPIPGTIANGNHKNNSLWIAVVDAEGTVYYTDITTKDDSSPSVTSSHVEDSLIIRDADGTTRLSGSLTLTDDGFEINWSAVGPLGFAVLAIEQVEIEPTAIPEFQASVTQIEEGTAVTFANLTNPNGATITGWTWDFGDGQTSTEQEPTHTYDGAGTYDVSLTVSVADGDPVTITKRGYIEVIYYPDLLKLLGPYDPVTVTNDTVTRRHYERFSDQDGNDLYLARLEYAIDLDGLLIKADPPLRTPPPGEVWIWYSTDLEAVRIIDANGRQGTVGTVVWDA